MKKISLIVLAFVTPVVVFASYLTYAQNYSVAPGSVVDGNLYAAGQTVSLAGALQKDAVIAASSVLMTGTIKDDLLGAGSTISVFGPVNGDVRLLGGQVTLADSVGGDAVIVAGTFTFLPKAFVHGDVISVTGTAMIDGTVSGNIESRGGDTEIGGTVNGSVRFDGERLTIGSHAVIDGDVEYSSAATLIVSDGALIKGEKKVITKSEMPVPTSKVPQVFMGLVAVISFAKIFATLIAVLIAVVYVKNPSKKVLEGAYHYFGRSLLVGLGVGIIVPVVGVMLSVSVFGIIVGVPLLLLYVIALFAAHVFAALFLGLLIFRVVLKSTDELSWREAVVGAIAYSFLWFIPVAGGIIGCLLCLAAFGSIAERLWNLVQKVR